MLIILDREIINHLEVGYVQNALDLLAQSRRLGNHLIFSEPEVLKVLARTETLSVRARRVFLKIYTLSPQKRVLVDKIKLRLKVVAAEGVLESSIDGEVTTIIASIKLFDSIDLVNKAVLLSENISDSKFYEIMARYFTKQVGLPSLRISSEVRGGGGSTTVDEYSELQKQNNRLCLCICDSDKKYPTATFGETAKNVVEINDLSLPFTSVHILNVRQKENLLPTALIFEAVEHDCNRMAGLNIIKLMERDIKQMPRKYHDFRKGIKRKQIFSVSKDTPFYKFWSVILSEIGVNIPLDCKDCGSTCQKTEKCLCILAPGVGAKIYDAVLGILLKKTDEELFKSVDEHVAEDWYLTGKAVCEWCCSGGPLIAA